MEPRREETMWNTLNDERRAEGIVSLAERAYHRYWNVFNENAPRGTQREVLRWFELPGWIRAAWENVVDFVDEERETPHA